ncbi:MAG: hypothetical protein ACYDA6_09925, partial [Solirubrobacteraceae bacterium]
MNAIHPRRPVDEGPPAMPWSDYQERLITTYQELVPSGATESDMQNFFARNPALVPGAFPNQIGHG